MKKSNPLLLITFYVVLLAFPMFQPAEAGRNNLLVNGDFEQGLDFPLAWNPGQPDQVSMISLDEQNVRKGRRSISINAASPVQATLVSDPVSLEVGAVYKLSAWIRTAGLFSDKARVYPTALPACLSMASFPFTNSSPAVGADSDWRKSEVMFVATAATDRVQLHLGRNGTAVGRAWFDEVRLEKVEDIAEFIPMETVRWFGPGFRYHDRGWTFLHIEGEPYERGYQHGFLLADEIAEYAFKLGFEKNRAAPNQGWSDLRFLTDSLFLRRFEEEYLLEMRGIADGMAGREVKLFGRKPDLLDIAVLNSSIDLGQLGSALRVTPNALSGRNFMRQEDEMLLSDSFNKCSSFVATGRSTRDGRLVFGQIFMWGGYTGVHWDLVIDIQPTSGHRLVMHSFPGGIHSGADFYINSAGIIIGETTVSQTPFNQDGSPQSNRIRKAAQYASSFAEVVDILSLDNNGMYTNDWTMGDTKTDEGANFLLGTAKSRLWRTGHGEHPADTPGGLRDFIWANNNNRDPEVRKEYLAQADNAPFDLIFRPANRDVAFQEFFRQYGDGGIDIQAAVELWASSPVNRPHACDGKLTSSEMAEKLVFLAHYGKTTLREKKVGGRFIADQPGARPHYGLGYAAFSPIYITRALQERRGRTVAGKAGGRETGKIDFDAAVLAALSFPKRSLWQNTVFPAQSADGWFVSASAAYHRLISALPDNPEKAAEYLSSALNELNCRYLYLREREEEISPLEARQVYDRYGHYDFSRIKGVILLHQLRLRLGNRDFAALLNEIHDKFAGREMSTADFMAVLGRRNKSLPRLAAQWLERKGIPEPRLKVRVTGSGREWRVSLQLDQDRDYYDFITSVNIETGAGVFSRRVEVSGRSSVHVFKLPAKPLKLVFNPGSDVLLARENYYTFANVFDDFQHGLIVYGSARYAEALRVMALNWQEVLAEAFLEILLPVAKDCEVEIPALAEKDLFLLGGPADNTLSAALAAAAKLPVQAGRDSFQWRGRTYSDADDGLMLAFPNPFNPERTAYLFLGNSALQLHWMTASYRRGLPAWALFKGNQVIEQGYIQDETELNR